MSYLKKNIKGSSFLNSFSSLYEGKFYSPDNHCSCPHCLTDKINNLLNICIENKYTWKTMYKDISDYVNSTKQENENEHITKHATIYRCVCGRHSTPLKRTTWNVC